MQGHALARRDMELVGLVKKRRNGRRRPSVASGGVLPWLVV